MRGLVGVLLVLFGLYLFCTGTYLAIIICIIGCAIADPVWESKEMKS